MNKIFIFFSSQDLYQKEKKMEGSDILSQILPMGITIGAVAVGAAVGDYVQIQDSYMEMLNAFVVGLFIYQLASYENLSKTALGVAIASAVGVGVLERFLENKMGVPMLFFLFVSGFAVGRPGLQFWSSTPFHIAFSNIVVSFLYAEDIPAGKKLMASLAAVAAPVAGFLLSRFGPQLGPEVFTGLLTGAQASVLFGNLIPRQKTPSIAASLVGYFVPSVLLQFTQ